MRKISLEEIADLENELQRLRAQVTALLPWAFSYLGYRSFANALGDEGEDLLDRIRAGEFSDRLSPPFRKWSDEENAVTDSLIEQATPFDVSGYEAL